MLALDRLGAELAGFVAREEDCAASLRRRLQLLRRQVIDEAMQLVVGSLGRALRLSGDLLANERELQSSLTQRLDRTGFRLAAKVRVEEARCRCADVSSAQLLQRHTSARVCIRRSAEDRPQY